jgi:hypothetical protein
VVVRFGFPLEAAVKAAFSFPLPLVLAAEGMIAPAFLDLAFFPLAEDFAISSLAARSLEEDGEGDIEHTTKQNH